MLIITRQYFTLFLLIISDLFTIIIGTVIIRVYDGSRILGGEYTTVQDHPYVVQVEHNGLAICGGSILTNSIIITAAHCIAKETPYTIRAGSTIRGIGGVIVPVKDVIIHDLFDRITLAFDFDIALLKLAKPLQFKPEIQPIELATEFDRIFADNFGIASGWGKSKLNEPFLQQVRLPILPQQECINAYNSNPYLDFPNITTRMFCASYLDDKGRDTCQGDSGGPLTVNKRLYGLTSWGADCGSEHYPGVYVRLTDHSLIDWIFFSIRLMYSHA